MDVTTGQKILAKSLKRKRNAGEREKEEQGVEKDEVVAEESASKKVR